jgi:hypothetical protein
MKDRVPLSRCQRKLADVWLVGCAVIFLLLLGQSVGGKYGSQVEKAWSWFIPTVLPTLSVIVGAVAYQARRDPQRVTADRFAFRMTIGLSLFYLILVIATMLLQPFSRMTPLELMAVSNLWLGPVQGLVGIMLGVFFASRQS